MRITCPNCQATYEVGDADIPGGGIEVECSACLNRWMQMPEGEEAAAPSAAISAPSGPSASSQPSGPSAPAPMPEPANDPANHPANHSVATPPSTPDPAPQPPASDPVSAPSRPLENTLESVPETAPQVGWRVPKPPKKVEESSDQLDRVLAEVDPAFAPISAPSTPPKVQDTPSAPPKAAAPNPQEPKAAPAPDAPKLDTPAPEPEPEPADQPLPKPQPAPHWSEQIAAVAPAAAMAASVSPSVAPSVAPAPASTAEDPKKDMEDLIRTLSASQSSAPSSPAPEPAEEPVFHPWDGDVAPKIVPAAEDTPTSETTEDDNFSWDEPADSADVVEDIFAPRAEQDPSAPAPANQPDGLRVPAPEISNVIQADIPQAPNATMGRSRPAVAKPGKPTPVESVEDVEAAIRAQMKGFQKPGNADIAEDDVVKPSLFGRKAKPALKPEKPANPLKEALLEDDTASAQPRSGRRTGFFLVIYLFLIALAVYLFGDQISNLVPALKPYITSFSGMVDSLRSETQRLMAPYL